MNITWQFDRPRAAAGLTLVALVQTRCHPLARGQAVCATASKRPLAVVVIEEEDVTAFELSGNTIPRTEFEARFPTALDQLRDTLRRGERS